MRPCEAGPVAYVVKRWPRLSETFIVHEILAHEAAGERVELVALKDPAERIVHDAVRRVRAPLRYLGLPGDTLPAGALERLAGDALPLLPRIPAVLAEDGPGSRRERYQAIQLALHALERGVRHFHAHFATSATTVARLASRLTGIPYSFTAHAKDIYHADVEPADLRAKLADAASAVTVSDHNLRHLRATYGAAAARVTRIYNGLDLGQFSWSAPRDRAPRVVFVGRLVEKKGVDVLLEAAALLAARGAQFACDIIGAGPLEAELQAQAARLRLDGRVFFRGPAPQPAVIAALRSAAVLAAPCVVGRDGDRDGLPTVLLEAMALGTPCVATPVTGIPEVLRDGETGLLVPERDPVALAEALARLLAGRLLRLRLAEQARARMTREFDLHQNAAMLRRHFAALGVAQEAV